MNIEEIARMSLDALRRGLPPAVMPCSLHAFDSNS
jgi:hypothetical protein